MFTTLAEADEALAAQLEVVAAAATALEDGVGSGLSVENLAHLLDELAVAEGGYAALQDAAVALEYADRTGKPAPVAARLTRGLLAGAGDEWSGRTNDVRRARYAGYRRVAERLLES